jgi:hypothetical protein
MSSHVSLGPADLDRLEDALEDLELGEGLLEDSELAADDPVAQRLVEYRQILQWSRQALPLEEVPAGLLDGVLAQARQAAAAGAAAVAPKPSFWARWRLSVWVPTLAFAGSAALLLLVLVPKDEEPGKAATMARAPGAESKADAKREADGRLASAEPDGTADVRDGEGEAVRGDGLAIGERAPDPAAAPPAAVQPPPIEAPAEEQAPADADELGTDERSKRRKSTAASGSATTGTAGARPHQAPPEPKAPTSAGGSKGKPSPTPDPLVDDEPSKTNKGDVGGEDPWPEITRADADRRGGSCGLAKMRYDKLRKVDDPRVRARALAGLGLCEAVADSMGTAKKLFAQARAADPDVSGFIDSELATLEDARADAYDPGPAE